MLVFVFRYFPMSTCTPVLTDWLTSNCMLDRMQQKQDLHIIFLLAVECNICSSTYTRNICSSFVNLWKGNNNDSDDAFASTTWWRCGLRPFIMLHGEANHAAYSLIPVWTGVAFTPVSSNQMKFISTTDSLVWLWTGLSWTVLMGHTHHEWHSFKHTFVRKTQGPAGALSNGLTEPVCMLCCFKMSNSCCAVYFQYFISYLCNTYMRFSSWEKQNNYACIYYILKTTYWVIRKLNIENLHSTKTV